MAKTEPNKAQAIQQLRLDTVLSLSEGKQVLILKNVNNLYTEISSVTGKHKIIFLAIMRNIPII